MGQGDGIKEPTWLHDLQRLEMARDMVELLAFVHVFVLF